MDFYAALNSSSIVDVMNSSSYVPNSYLACLTYESGVPEIPSDFPPNEIPVWILGKSYSTMHELEDLRADIRTRLRLSYRKNFSPIGGTGPTSDYGWGCMLRCGQMVLAQALIMRHLGRDWLWQPEKKDPIYFHILKMFQDKKRCMYSIHQIAQMGVSEGKAVGQWFGPNTIAQVLRKLVVYDKWSSIVVHIAMDNCLFINDIKTLCKKPKNSSPPCMSPPSECNETSACHLRSQRRTTDHESSSNIILSANCVPEGAPMSRAHKEGSSGWKPLLLFIPLRLGLSEINQVYFKALKAVFTLKQTLGILGGKPNHAMYFIGCVGNELIFLDPHTVLPTVDLDTENPDDSSYHSPFAGRMLLDQLDPSIALCFYCETEEEFDSFCKHSYQLLVSSDSQPLFEMSDVRPPHWPPFQPSVDPVENTGACSLEFTILDNERKFDTSDDEFELL